MRRIFFTLALGAACLQGDVRMPLLKADIRGVTNPGLADRVLAPPTIIDPLSMHHAFGRKVAQQCLGVQVLVTNNSGEFDFVVKEISLLVSKADGTQMEMSSLQQEVLTGVALRGQSSDPRNVVLRVLRGAGTIAATVATFATVGPSFAPAIAAFNGPGLEGYNIIFPDYTVDQLVRLNRAAFQPNRVIPRNRAEKLVIFLPISVLLTKEETKLFRKEPNLFFTKVAASYQVAITGDFIEPVRAD